MSNLSVSLLLAGTQNNRGLALARLGDRESGTARLQQALAAYDEALKEWTRERVPRQWAMTQNNRGNALAVLGKRESRTARLEQAVAAYDACLTLVETVWPAKWVQQVRLHRDETRAEITRQSTVDNAAR